MSNGIADSAVGAILEIPPSALADIQKAERYIDNLQITSKRAAEAVKSHWGEIATSGLDTFIKKLSDAQEMMKGMSGSKVDFNINTNQATEKVSSASKQIEKDLYAISKTVQQVAQDFDFSNPEASLKKWGNTFREIEAQIRNTAAVRKGMATDDPEVDKYNRLIEVLKEYIAQKKKSQATVGAEQAKAEAKAIAAGDKLIAQKEAQIAKQEAAEQKAAQDYEKWWLSALAKVEAEQAKTDAKRNAQRTAQAEQDAQRRANAQANAEKEVNDILTKRIELQQKITALNTKQSISALSDPTAKLNFSDSANLHKYERQMQTLEQRLREISVLYPKLARDSESAFNTQKADLLALSMQKIADEQVKIASGTSTSKATDVEDRLNALYTERLRLLKEIEQLNNKDMLNKAKGLSGISAEENQLLGKLNDRLKIVNQNITTIGQNYVGLALKAKHAFELPELRQTIQLQNQLNDALKSVDTSNAKQLTAEYKRLTAEAQKLAQSMREYTAAGGDKNSTAYQQLEAQFRNIMMQRRIIEMENVDEVNNYRQQRQTAAYQADLSAFVQAEAQKTAEAKKQADERARQQAEAQQKYLNSAQGAMWYSRQLNKGKVDNSYENRERAIKQLESAIKSLDKNDKDYDKTLEKLTRTLNVLKNAQKDVADAMKPTKPMVSPQDAINAAKNATSLKQLQDAYKQLKDVMANTNPKSQAWSQMNTQLQKTKTHIDEIKKKMGEFHTQSVNVSGIVGQLRNQIASLFAVGAITNYIKKMTEVRAQFELQRVALGAIIQDSDEANKIFLRIQQMALESPFNIMQLERATKQIAAFGFETQKLVPTMKMFADISAGLGVEIDRITLVMGHLKARNFLEGTMVRQFTNMGFNILGELAKYYTELEDRLISVGEVQDRVKKKMISFEDVEEVLKRVTSQGGMFYDMQRKQAESLYGQIQRIKDATDLMLNDIGKSNQGLIGGALTMLRTLIAHWRDVWNVIKMVGSATAAYVLVTKAMRAMGVTSLKEISTWWKILRADIATATTGVKASTIATNALSAAMKGLMSSTGIGIIVAALATLASYLWMTTSAADALNEELGRISDESVKNVNESIATFRTLADTVGDSSKLYSEREEAMKELSRIYGDILPKEKLEWDYIVGLNGDYKELTETITKYYAAKEYQQKVEQVLGGETAKDLISQVQDYMLKKNKDGVFGMMFPESVLKAKAEAIARELSEGKIANSADAIANRIAESLNIDFNYKSKDFKDIIKTNGEIQDSLGGIEIAAIMATNATMDLKDSIGQMDANQLAKTTEDLLKRNKEIEKSLASTPSMMTEERRESFARYNVELEANNRNLELITQAQAKLVEQKFEEKVDELTKNLIKEGNAYADAVQGMKSLERQGRTNDKQYQDYIATIKKVKGEQELLEEQFGVKLPLAQLATCKTSYEVEQVLDEVAKQAFPAVAKAAFDSMSDADRAILMTETGLLSFLQNVKTGLAKFSPALANLIPDFSAKIAENNEKIKVMGVEWGKVGEKAEDAAESIGSVYSRRANAIADATGADIRKLDDVIKKNMNAAETAKQLRSEAKKAQEVVDSYTQSSNKQTWLAAHPEYTAERLSQMKKDIEGYTKLAKELDGVEKGDKGGKGKDPILELWKNRLKAVQDYYTAREKARKNLSATETEIQQVSSFEQLWKELNLDKIKGLSLNDLVLQGFDPKTLQKDLVSALEQLKTLIPDKYADVKKEIERTIAKEKIEIQFKVKEEEFNKLKTNLDEMFASYDLTMEFKKAGINVDLIYMLGGKPTTLQDIRDELERLRKEGGGSADAENRIKILEDAEKKLTQIELKEQKERLKNYEKYLKQAYSDSAKVQLEYFVKLQQMQEDFAKAEKDLNKQLSDPETSTEDKFKIQKALEDLPNQASRAARGMREEMEKELDKLNLDKLLKSPLFSEMFQDLGSMTNSVLDKMLDKIKTIQKSANDLSLSQIRQLAQYAEKIENAKLDNSPFKEAYNAIKKAYELRAKGITAKSASDSLAVSEEELERLETLKNDISLILGIKEKSYAIDGDRVVVGGEQVNLTKQQVSLLGKSTTELNKQLGVLEDQSGELDGSIKKQKQVVTVNSKNVQTFKNALTATEKLSNALKKAAEAGKEAINAVTAGMQLFGKEVSDADQEWLDFVGNMMDAGIELAIMFVALGATISNALGIIGIISTALTFVAGLFKAIFQAHDKRLEKEISKVQDRVDTLSKAFEKLEKSIERAFTIGDETRLTEQALSNLEAQKRAYQEMIRLEEAKKKTDDDKIKDYKDKLAELAEAEEELYEKRHEKWGSTNDVWDEANNWVDAWLDAYKETGDGLDALNESWDEFYENLVKKQATSKVLGSRMDKYIQEINKAIDKNMSEYGYVDAFKEIGERFKKEFGDLNQGLIDFFNYAGIGGGTGELILSDLQKGIQNITEPQAAAIEAYLNSMRFAVFRHTEQLDTLIATIQMQYGSGADNPVVTELKGIRGVLDNIDRRLASVINTQGRNATLRIGAS